MNKRKDPIENILTLHRACPEAIEWARRFDTLDEVWQKCEQPTWLLWGLQTFEYPRPKRLRLFTASLCLRLRSIWGSPQVDIASNQLTEAASSDLAAAAFVPTYQSVKRAAEAFAESPDYSEAGTAAASAILAALGPDPFESALAASEQALRAVAWDVTSHTTVEEAARWQCSELRRILGDDIYGWIAQVREKARGKLPIL